MKRKVNGAKNKNSIMGPQSHCYVGNVQWTKEGYSRIDPAGPSRDIKRKMSPPKVRNRALGDCSATEVEGFKELKGLIFSSLSPKSDENGKKGIKMEKPKVTNKPSPQASVKGKKALALSRKTSNSVNNRDNPSDPQAANIVLRPHLCLEVFLPMANQSREQSRVLSPLALLLRSKVVVVPRIVLVEVHACLRWVCSWVWLRRWRVWRMMFP